MVLLFAQLQGQLFEALGFVVEVGAEAFDELLQVFNLVGFPLGVGLQLLDDSFLLEIFSFKTLDFLKGFVELVVFQDRLALHGGGFFFGFSHLLLRGQTSFLQAGDFFFKGGDSPFLRG